MIHHLFGGGRKLTLRILKGESSWGRLIPMKIILSSLISFCLLTTYLFGQSSERPENKKDKTEGLFVTVGHSGTILTSSDGTSWTERTSGTSMSLRGVTYGNGLFVTVDDRGTILTSSNGIFWTQRTSGTSDYLYGVTYGNGLFVSVGSKGTILTSSNGTSWTQRTS